MRLQLCCIVFLLGSSSALAHSGRTDKDGGHNGPGGYHYHGGGKSRSSSSSGGSSYSDMPAPNPVYSENMQTKPTTSVSTVKPKPQEEWALRAYQESLSYSGADRVSYVRMMYPKVEKRCGKELTMTVFVSVVAKEMSLTDAALLGESETVAGPEPKKTLNVAPPLPVFVDPFPVVVDAAEQRKQALTQLKLHAKTGTQQQFDVALLHAKMLHSDEVHVQLDELAKNVYALRSWK